MISGSLITVMSVFNCSLRVLLPITTDDERDWTFMNRAPTTLNAIMTDAMKKTIWVADAPAPILASYVTEYSAAPFAVTILTLPPGAMISKLIDVFGGHTPPGLTI